MRLPQQYLCPISIAILLARCYEQTRAGARAAVAIGQATRHTLFPPQQDTRGALPLALTPFCSTYRCGVLAHTRNFLSANIFVWFGQACRAPFIHARRALHCRTRRRAACRQTRAATQRLPSVLLAPRLQAATSDPRRALSATRTSKRFCLRTMPSRGRHQHARRMAAGEPSRTFGCALPLIARARWFTTSRTLHARNAHQARSTTAKTGMPLQLPYDAARSIRRACALPARAATTRRTLRATAPTPGAVRHHHLRLWRCLRSAPTSALARFCAPHFSGAAGGISRGMRSIFLATPLPTSMARC